MPTIHITGHKGQLGRCFLDQGCVPLDVPKEGDIIVNCAAKTNHDYCNQNPDEAWKSNVDYVRLIAKVAEDFKCYLIHISTDYVFSGHSTSCFYGNDQRRPVAGNAYALTKAIGEMALEASSFSNWICIRIGWLFTPYKKPEWLEMPTVWHQHGTPVWGPNLVQNLINIQPARFNKRGFYHFGSLHSTSRQRMAALFTGDVPLEVEKPEDRPLGSALSMGHVSWDPDPLYPDEIVSELKKHWPHQPQLPR